jgi:hypothetical protein
VLRDFLHVGLERLAVAPQQTLRGFQHAVVGDLIEKGASIGCANEHFVEAEMSVTINKRSMMGRCWCDGVEEASAFERS